MTDYQHREDCYMARRIIRAAPGGATDKRLRREASERVMRLVEILPPLLAVHCIARAEDMCRDQT